MTDRRTLVLPLSTVDTMDLREGLALFLHDWNEAEFIALPVTERFRRLAKRLARRAGLTYDEVMFDLRSDAHQIAAR